MNLEKFSPKSWFKKETPEHHPIFSQDGPIGLPVSQLHKEIDRLFGNMLENFGASTFSNSDFMKDAETMLKPQLDIKENDKEYKICVEIPGVQEEDIQIEVQGDTLSIRGEKKQEKEDKNENYHKVERSYGAFQRLLSLPEDADVEHIDASFNAGILNVRVAKNDQAKPSGRKIEVNKKLH